MEGFTSAGGGAGVLPLYPLFLAFMVHTQARRHIDVVHAFSIGHDHAIDRSIDLWI